MFLGVTTNRRNLGEIVAINATGMNRIVPSHQFAKTDELHLQMGQDDHPYSLYD